MKLKVNSAYTKSIPRVKVNGVWKETFNGWVKVNNEWRRFLGAPSLERFYTGRVTVGNYDAGDYKAYGFIGTSGALNPSTGKTPLDIRYLIIGDKPYVAGEAFRWLEMALAGDQRNNPNLSNCRVNGMVGELRDIFYSSQYDSSYVQWLLPAPLPTSGTWDVVF